MLARKQLGTGPLVGEVQPVYMLGNLDVPIGFPSSGTIGDNGALTLTTALPYSTYNPHFWFYFPVNAIYAGSLAGFYYTVMQASTTVGIIYADYIAPVGTTYSSFLQNTYTPASPTALVCTGPGAYTQITTGQTLASYLLKGGTLGINGSLHINHEMMVPNTANNKTWNIICANSAYNAVNRASGITHEYQVSIVRSCGRYNKQTACTTVGLTAATGTAAISTTSLNLDIDGNVGYAFTLANAADYAILLDFTVKVFPGN